MRDGTKGLCREVQQGRWWICNMRQDGGPSASSGIALAHKTLNFPDGRWRTCPKTSSVTSFPQARAWYHIKPFLGKSGLKWDVPTREKGLLPSGSLLGSLLPSHHRGQNHRVLAGKGVVHQSWVQGKEMPQAPQDVLLCHCGKAQPKRARCWGPFTEAFTVSHLALVTPLPLPHQVLRHHHCPRWSRILQLCATHRVPGSGFVPDGSRERVFSMPGGSLVPLPVLTGGQSTALPKAQQVVGLRKKKKPVETRFIDKCEVLGSVGNSLKQKEDWQFPYWYLPSGIYYMTLGISMLDHETLAGGFPCWRLSQKFSWHFPVASSKAFAMENFTIRAFSCMYYYFSD